MSRRRYTEVSCDRCSDCIDYVPSGRPVTKFVKEKGPKGCVINKDGDFCSKYCADQFKLEKRTDPLTRKP
jgi:hypothetical protein